MKDGKILRFRILRLSYSLLLASLLAFTFIDVSFADRFLGSGFDGYDVCRSLQAYYGNGRFAGSGFDGHDKSQTNAVNFSLALAVESAYGGQSPGTTTNLCGSVLSLWVTNSPVGNGTTQYVGNGGVVLGNDYSQVNSTNITLTLTNHAVLTWTWATNYWLDAGCSGSGGVDVADSWMLAGSSVVITAIASNNWHFSGWSGETGGCAFADNVITAAMSQARAITANFAINTFTVAISSDHGTATPVLGIHTTNWGAFVNASVVTPEIVGASTQYVSTGWIGAGSVTNGTGTNTGFMVTNNSTLTWLWATNYLLTVGRTNCVVNVADGLYGTNVTVTATPSAGYHFVTWTGDTNGCIISSNSITAVMNRPRLIAAISEINMFNITATADPNGTITPSGTVQVALGGGASFVIAATNVHYYIADVVVDGSSVGPSNSYDFVNVTNAHTIAASFALDTCALVVTTPHGVTIPAGATTNGWNSVINATVTTPIYDGVTTQYVCIGWTGTGSVTNGFGTNTAFSITNNSTINWLWVTNYLLTVDASNCTVSVTNGFYGTNVTVTAMPNTGHHFVSWTGDTNGCTASANSITAPMTQVRTITAVCGVDMFSIAASAGPNGVIAPSGTIAVAYGANTNFVITPSAFYHVRDVTVDGSSVGLSNGYMFANVTNNHSILSVFSENMTTNGKPTPEWWLNQYYGVTDYTAVAEQDTDGDGMLAWAEYIAGTDPTNRLSVLAVTMPDVMYGTNYFEFVSEDTNYIPSVWVTQRIYEVIGHKVAWTSVTGRVYDLMFVANLTSNVWSIVEGASNIMATPPQNTFTNETASFLNKLMFYRVNVKGP